MNGYAAREAARESGDERVQSLNVNSERCLDFARDDKKSAFPEKFRRTIDFRRQTFVHRTIERGLLKRFTVR